MVRRGMELRYLRYFATVAGELDFSAAPHAKALTAE